MRPRPFLSVISPLIIVLEHFSFQTTPASVVFFLKYIENSKVLKKQPQSVILDVYTCPNFSQLSRLHLIS